MPHPLDEYPIHQVPMSMRYVASSDRNVYDRNIFQAMSRDGAVQLIAGYGVYPNLGVVDGYGCVRMDDKQYVTRASDAAHDNKLDMRVGPFRIEVIEPLAKLRLICDNTDSDGVAYDITWTAAAAPIDEPQHITRTGARIQLDACRFAGTGLWEGTVSAAGQDFAVTHDTWVGTRDRSWGIRPVGESEPQTRYGMEHELGMWWCWVPLRFEDHSMMVIIQEGPDGHRVLTEAVRMFPTESGRHVEQLGWPEIDIAYRPGSRYPTQAVIHVAERGRQPFDVTIELLGGMALNVGCGYGADPDWNHGRWMGRGYVANAVYDMADAAVAGRVGWAPIDFVARATQVGGSHDGAVGYGIFEHMSIGRHEPSGMADIMSVAP